MEKNKVMDMDRFMREHRVVVGVLLLEEDLREIVDTLLTSIAKHYEFCDDEEFEALLEELPLERLATKVRAHGAMLVREALEETALIQECRAAAGGAR